MAEGVHGEADLGVAEDIVRKLLAVRLREIRKA
jgi:hypothetical protein